MKSAGYRIVETLIVGFFIGSMFFLVLQWDSIHNTFEAKRLILTSLIIGGFGSFVLIKMLKKVIKKINESWAAYASILLGSLAFSPASVSYINNSNAAHTELEVELNIVGKSFKEESARSHAEWQIIVDYQNSSKNIIVSRKLWEEAVVGNPVVLSIATGMFGYKFVPTPQYKNGVAY